MWMFVHKLHVNKDREDIHHHTFVPSIQSILLTRTSRFMCCNHTRGTLQMARLEGDASRLCL